MKYFDEIYSDFGWENFVITNYANFDLIEKEYNEIIPKVALNTPITNINYSNSGIKLSTKSND